MNILAIETSCDETAAAVVREGRRVLSSVVSSQIPLHQPYSGVVPEIASRAHVLLLNSVIEEALRKAKVSLPVSMEKPAKEQRSTGRISGSKKLDAIAVTVGPGLMGSLLVGKMTAEALSWLFNIPLIGVNHIEGHLLSPILADESLKPPFLGLVVSGGHTELILARNWTRFELIGRTRDDAAGEAFDKAAKMLALGYPGGPVIDRWARSGDANKCPFPRPWLPGTWDFSFSGLKTAVLYKLRKKKRWRRKEKQDICAGFQQAVVDVLVGKTLAAVERFGMNQVVVGGGVAANSLLRRQLIDRAEGKKIKVFIAPPELCTDNAAMIASAAYFRSRVANKFSSSLKIQPQLHIPFVQKRTAGFELPSSGQ